MDGRRMVGGVERLGKDGWVGNGRMGISRMGIGRSEYKW
jgi:hypothetical protein